VRTITAFPCTSSAWKSSRGQLSDQTPTILNEAGDTRSTPQNWKFQVDRSRADTGARTHFDTGPVSYSVTLMASIYGDRIANGSNSPNTTRLAREKETHDGTPS
jgi:iron complex outermembrane recepter protein